MKKFAALATLCFFLSPSATVLGAPLSADDFLPPVQAASEEEQDAITNIKQPDEVVEETGFDDKPAIKAASAQDAINAAVTHIPAGGGCLQIKFPSGFGWVASGVGTYMAMPDATATLTAQRLAYQKAYLQAKKSLAESLYGLSTTGLDSLSSEIDVIITGNDSAANTTEKSEESITERVNGLLRGYVVYSVNDEQDAQHGIVTVTIVTTPKTMGKFGRVGTSGLSADSVRDGLNHVLAELSSGLMPPVGGKTISVPQTGELAFVGFGTAVIVSNPNPAVQAKMTLNAQKIAQMRARSALCGIILGDDVAASSQLDEKTKELTAQFEEFENDDPLKAGAAADEVNVRKLEEQRVDFVNNQSFREEITSFRSGVLPAGVTVRTFFNENKTMAEAVAIYLPSVTASADSARKTMQNSQILAPVDAKMSSKTDNSGAMPQRGPSGQVSNDADL